MLRPRRAVFNISHQSRRKNSTIATSEPKWTVASNAADGASQPSAHAAMIM